MAAFPWLKGHGTENDFVLLPDPDGTVHGDLPADVVRFLCDRRRGIGADGVLRVVRSKSYAPARRYADDAKWFMDYRNADGSVAEMCGNGVRVFARYLREAYDLPDRFAVATRGGVRRLAAHEDGTFTVDVGAVQSAGADIVVAAAGRTWPAVGLRLPNPHAVAFVADLFEAGPLLEPPQVTPAEAFPEGVNVEFVVPVGDQHIAMRVHERGVGETRSCGTGACAAAVAAMRQDHATPGTPYLVDVPGGRLTVTQRPTGEIELTGPAVIGVRGAFERRWLAEPGW